MRKNYSMVDYTTFTDIYERVTPENAWNITSDEVTVAAKLDSSSLYPKLDIDAETVARIQFYWLENVGDNSFAEQNEQKRTYVPAVYCKDIYKKFMDPESSQYLQNMKDELSNDWICPNVTNYDLYGDPQFMPFQRGKSFFMIVNSCNVAKVNDQRMIA